MHHFGHQKLANVTLPQAPISVDEIVARRRLSLKRKRAANVGDDLDEEDEDEDKSEDDEDDEEEEGEEDEDASEDPLASSDEEGIEAGEEVEDGHLSDADSSSSEEEETEADKSRKAAFFADEEQGPSSSCETFLDMNLSRPILKAISTLGFQKPTPIQASTIPVALLGKDIVGNAVTGSGKTAAFLVPMLERLLYREKGKKAAATRCLVLLPTRELAVQCYEVGKKLGAHTDVQFCLIVGEYPSSTVSRAERSPPSRRPFHQGSRSSATPASRRNSSDPWSSDRSRPKLSWIQSRFIGHPCTR
jgi:ATP-dependent RNA helicase DDX27